MAGAEPFTGNGRGVLGRVGVVMGHGLAGTPHSMRPWALQLDSAGYAVRLPRLPGHGTRWEELNETRWMDWYGELFLAYVELSARCDQVFACGLSTGGTLLTRLAEEVADSLSGLI